MYVFQSVIKSLPTVRNFVPVEIYFVNFMVSNKFYVTQIYSVDEKNLVILFLYKIEKMIKTFYFP